MLKDFRYGSLLQVCEGVQGKAKVKGKEIDYQPAVKNVERTMYPHLGFYVCPSCGVCVCGDDIFVIGYNESTVMHKKRKCIYKRDEYFQLKFGKFLCREALICQPQITYLTVTQVTYCILGTLIKIYHLVISFTLSQRIFSIKASKWSK